MSNDVKKWVRSVTDMFAGELLCLMVKIACSEEAMNSCKIFLETFFFLPKLIDLFTKKMCHSEKNILLDVHMVFSTMKQKRVRFSPFWNKWIYISLHIFNALHVWLAQDLDWYGMFIVHIVHPKVRSMDVGQAPSSLYRLLVAFVSFAMCISRSNDFTKKVHCPEPDTATSG